MQSKSEWGEPPLEIGKRDILKNNRLGLVRSPQQPVIFGIDIGTFLGEAPLTGPLLREGAGIKIHDTRMIRLMEVLLHTARICGGGAPRTRRRRRFWAIRMYSAR